MKLIPPEKRDAVRDALQSNDPKKLGKLLERTEREGINRGQNGRTRIRTMLTVTILHATTPYNSTTMELDGEKIITIGRDTHANLPCTLPNISRAHVKITITEGTIAIEDRGSGNGTYYGGQKIPSGCLLQFEMQSLVRYGDGDRRLYFNMCEPSARIEVEIKITEVPPYDILGVKNPISGLKPEQHIRAELIPLDMSAPNQQPQSDLDAKLLDAARRYSRLFENRRVVFGIPQTTPYSADDCAKEIEELLRQGANPHASDENGDVSDIIFIPPPLVPCMIPKPVEERWKKSQRTDENE